jgi:signal transduction histidine kinase
MAEGARDPDLERALATLNLAGARLGYLLAAVLMPGGIVLDAVAAPEKLEQFAAIRMAASALSLALLGCSYLPAAARHPVAFGAGPPLLCAVAIEAMILSLDSLVSPYYAGLNLCILAVAVLYTWRWPVALLVSGAIVGVWLVPAGAALARGTIAFAPFFNNLYFLLLTGVISVSSAVIRYRGAAREFTARARVADTSRELAHTLERLQELDRLKNEFFANISHELRTPLTLILTPVEDLLTRPLLETQRDALSVVRKNAQRLLRLIDDLLDLARLDAGGLRLQVAEIDVVELTNRVIERAGAAARTRKMTLELNAPAQLDVHADPHRLETVLSNLLGNALKFTPDGGAVRVEIEADKEQVRVRVRDTGPGIPEGELERIFERFYQVEGSQRRRHGGAGMGLALAKRLVELHGGSLSVTSRVGGGSCFECCLPRGREHFKDEVLERRRTQSGLHPNRRSEDRPALEPALASSPAAALADAPAPPVWLDRGRRPRVLVAEDERDLRDYLVTTLAEHYDVVPAGDGGEALRLLASSPFDLVLTDMMMPDSSGTDLCRAIRADTRLAGLPVIVLTALSSSDDALEAYAAGADDFVTKPFHSRVLLARIRAQLRLRALGFSLVNQARLATASLLAGGVAHEVKNPLNAILNAARMLPHAKGRPDLMDKLLAVMLEGSERIQGIIESLEDHARPADGADAQLCDLELGLSSSLKLLEHRLGAIQVHSEYHTRRPALGSARELNQVFLNLLDNAVRARPRNIWLRVSESPLGVCLCVEDDGAGVAEDIATLIFEPFFTTRPVGEGTGLGLYLARRIVDAAGGSVRYEERAGGGARFVVELRALAEGVSAGRGESAPELPAAGAPA